MEELGKAGIKEDQGNLTQIKCSNGLSPGTSTSEKRASYREAHTKELQPKEIKCSNGPWDKKAS